MDNPGASSKLKESEEDAGPNEQATAPHLPQDRSRNSESICDQCSKVDWASVPSLAAADKVHYCVQKLRSINESSGQLAASSCKICRILSLIVLSPSLGQRQRFLYAEPLSYQLFSPEILRLKTDGVTVLSHSSNKYNEWSIGRSKYLVAVTRSSNSSSLILPSSIDYNMFKRLLSSCKENHGTACSTRSPYQITGLKVIDVSLRTVVEAPEDCQYLALSYVWGRQVDPFTGDVLQCVSPLIEDAMSVTIALGYNYLWIDRYVSGSQFMYIFLSNSDLT